MSTPQALSQSHSRQNEKDIGEEVLVSALDPPEHVVTWDQLGQDGDLEPFEGPCSLWYEWKTLSRYYDSHGGKKDGISSI